jgi:hypothetical protein
MGVPAARRYSTHKDTLYMLALPPAIRTDSNAFAHDTMSRRIPSILDETLVLNPDYAPSIVAAVRRLRDEVLADVPIRMFAPPAPDYALWAEMLAEHANETWQNGVWFFAEPYVYRLLLEATRWFATGRDPFAPKKAEEFASDALWQTLDEALGTQSLPIDERLAALLEFDLWGNRIDLSHAVAAAHGAKASEGDLLVDDTARAIARLHDAAGVVHIVCDNCGTELTMDCALVDALLAAGHEVWMHVKIHPFFVSDTLVGDVHHLWRLFSARGGDAARLGERLCGAFEAERLRLLPDFFWCSARFLWEMPTYLHQTFRGAALVILKGDLNFRRSVGDAIWQPDTPFADVVSYFPAPLLALRALKSDPVVGLPHGVAEALHAEDPNWRVNGKRGMIVMS